MMDYQRLYDLDQQHTAGLEPVEAARQLSALTEERARTEITAEELWENTDLTEYRALAVPQRDAYALIAGLGAINVEVGSNSRATLAALFPAGSATRANLVALVQETETVSVLAANGLPARVYAADVEKARERYGGA